MCKSETTLRSKWDNREFRSPFVYVLFNPFAYPPRHSTTTSYINNDVGIDWFILKIWPLQIFFLFKADKHIIFDHCPPPNLYFNSIFDWNQHDKCRFIFKINIQNSYLLLFVLMVIENTLKTDDWKLRSSSFFSFRFEQKKFRCACSFNFRFYKLPFGMHFWLKIWTEKRGEFRCVLQFENEFVCVEKFHWTQNRSARSNERPSEKRK